MRLFPAVLMFCWLCHAAIASESAGKLYTSNFEIAGKQIPLPEGQWRLIAERNVSAGIDPVSVEDLRQVILVQLQGQVVSALIVATANIAPSTSGWGTSRDCTRQDILMAILQYQSALDVSCSFINHIVTAADNPSSVIDAELARESKAQGWSVPVTWLMAGFRVADRRDIIDIRYHFNPELAIPARAARPWPTNPWSRPAVSASRNRAAVVASLSNWVIASREMIEDGFRRRLPSGASLSSPWRDGALGPAAPASERPEPPLAIADWGRSLEKTISWRVVGTLADVAVAYAFTGSFALSGALALTGSVVNAALYFGHEVVWDALDPSGRKQPAVLEVPGIGSTS